MEFDLINYLDYRTATNLGYSARDFQWLNDQWLNDQLLNELSILEGRRDPYYSVFSEACRIGLLNVAQWLLKVKPDINISANDEEAFKWSCEYDQLDVAEWLLEIKPDINISANNDEAFFWSCRKGHLDVAQWLCTLDPNYWITVHNDEIIDYYGKY